MVKKLLSLTLCALSLILFCLPANAVWEPPFALEADEVFLYNLDTDTVIYEKASDQPHAIASITKSMTALLLLESGEDLNTMVTVPQRLENEFQRIKDEDGAYLNLMTDEEISLRDLLYAMLLPSTNDCASMIADYLSDGNIEAFVDRMNERAAQLGCENTHFSCPHGLYDEGNYSTAADLFKIARACLQNETFMEVATTPSYWMAQTNLHTNVQTPGAPEGFYLQLNSTIQLQNPESPVYRDYFHGLKTGFTDAAGRCLMTSAQRNGETWVLVLLGVPNQKDENGVQVFFRYADSLMDWALERFTVGEPTLNDDISITVPLNWCKESACAELTASGSLPVRLLDNETELRYEPLIPESLNAPVCAGQEVGTLNLWQDDRLLGTLTLSAEQDYAYSPLLYWQEKLSPYRGWLIAAGIALFVLILLLILLPLRIRAVKRRRAMRRQNRAWRYKQR